MDNIKIYPTVVNGKEISPLDCVDWYKHKITVEFAGYAVLLQGNGVCAAEDIKDMLGEDYKAISVSPNYVEVYKKSDYENAKNEVIKAGANNGR